MTGPVMLLVLAGMVTFLVAVSVVCRAAENIRIAGHTGRDPRSRVVHAKGAAATQLVDKVVGTGHPSGGSTD